MMKHLTDKTKEFVLNNDSKGRIRFVREFKWIGYTEGMKIIDKLEDLLEYPKSIRMPNILLIGDSNNGKTAILHKFSKKHQAYIDEETEKVVNPVILIQAPPEPDEKRFYNAILEQLFAPYKTSEKLDSRYMRVKGLLSDLQTKMLIIDEIHHVLAGSPVKQRLFLNVIKHLSNDLRIPLICAGTRLAFNVIQSDTQLANRFEPRVLPRWSNDTEFKRLLLSFEKILPLKKESNLIASNISSKILSLSDGLIGEVAKVLELATVNAIKSGEEKITLKSLSELDFIPPDKRKKKYF